MLKLVHNVATPLYHRFEKAGSSSAPRRVYGERKRLIGIINVSRNSGGAAENE